MTTRANYVQPVEGVAGGTAIPVSVSSSNQLDTIHNDLVYLGNCVDGIEGFVDGLEGYTDGVEGKLDTLHTDLGTTIHTDLATTLGGKLDTLHTDLGTTLHNDITGNLKILAPETLPVAVRTFAATVADVTVIPTDASTWVTLTGAAYAGYVDLSLDITAVAGTVAPTQVNFKVWNRIGGATGSIKKIHDQTFDASWLVLPKDTNPYTRIHIPCNSDEVFVTVYFPDGTAGTITGTVNARAVAFAGLQRKDLTYDPATGRPVVQSAAYDSATCTDKNSPSVMECDLVTEEPLVVNLTSQIAGTVYAPSETGAVMLPSDSISYEYKLIAGSGGTITVTWEATNGSDAWAQANNITLSGSSGVLGTKHLANTVVAGSAETIADLVQFDNLNAARIRMKIVVATQTSGALTVSMRRKVRGS